MSAESVKERTPHPSFMMFSMLISVTSAKRWQQMGAKTCTTGEQHKTRTVMRTVRTTSLFFPAQLQETQGAKEEPVKGHRTDSLHGSERLTSSKAAVATGVPDEHDALDTGGSDQLGGRVNLSHYGERNEGSQAAGSTNNSISVFKQATPSTRTPQMSSTN